MNYTIATFYNRISFLYPAISCFLARQRRTLINEVNKMNPGNLLEIGVGNGSHLPLYASHQVTGIDVSETMLKKARRYAGCDTKLLLMNGESLLFAKNSFDYVVMSHVLAVTEDHDKLLEQVYRVLKPGGKLFVLNHFTPDNLLKYIDMAFHPFSSLLHFKSLFYLKDVSGLKMFTLVSQTGQGIGSYFKLLIYSKP